MIAWTHPGLVVADLVVLTDLVLSLHRLSSLEAEEAQSALRALHDRSDVDLLFTDIILPGA